MPSEARALDLDPVRGSTAAAVDHGLQLHVSNFRSIRDIVLRIDSPLAILGEDGLAGSSLLRAVRCLIDARSRPGPHDFRDPSRPLVVELSDASGQTLARLRAHRSGAAVRVRRDHRSRRADRVLYLPVTRRGGLGPRDIVNRLAAPNRDGSGSELSAWSDTPLDLLSLCEACRACEARSAWILIEEPELLLGPHAQRALASLLRAVAACGTHVLYTTHSPNLIDSRHPDGIVRITRDPDGALVAVQAPHTPPSDVPDLVRHLASFDRERNAMFFAQRVLLVEGASERLSLPFAFRLLGHEPDAEGVAIIDAGGKGNLPFLATTLRSLDIPTVVLHDRDAPLGQDPSEEDQHLNLAIARAVGEPNVVQMAPDFEGLSGLRAHLPHKPARAWGRYAVMAHSSELPATVVAAIRQLLRPPANIADAMPGG